MVLPTTICPWWPFVVRRAHLASGIFELILHWMRVCFGSSRDSASLLYYAVYYFSSSVLMLLEASTVSFGHLSNLFLYGFIAHLTSPPSTNALLSSDCKCKQRCPYTKFNATSGSFSSLTSRVPSFCCPDQLQHLTSASRSFRDFVKDGLLDIQAAQDTWRRSTTDRSLQRS